MRTLRRVGVLAVTALLIVVIWQAWRTRVAVYRSGQSVITVFRDPNHAPGPITVLAIDASDRPVGDVRIDYVTESAPGKEFTNEHGLAFVPSFDLLELRVDQVELELDGPIALIEVRRR